MLKRLTWGISSRWVTGLLLIFWLTSPVTAQTVLTPTSCEGASGYRSQRTDQPTSIQFVNQSFAVIKIDWLDLDGQRKPYGTWSPGSTVLMNTFVAHPWVITNDNGVCIAVYFPKAEPSQAVVSTDDHFRALQRRLEELMPIIKKQMEEESKSKTPAPPTPAKQVAQVTPQTQLAAPVPQAQSASAPATALAQTPSAAPAKQNVLDDMAPGEWGTYYEATKKFSAAEKAAAADQFAAQYPRSHLRGRLYIKAMDQYGYGFEADHAKVVEMGNKALAADPTNPAVLVDVAVLWTESARTTDADYEQRLTDATRLAQSSISHLDSGLVVGRAAKPEAIAASKASILSDAYDVLGQVDMSRKRFISAEVQFKKALDACQAKPKEKIYLHLAEVQEHLKKYALALDSVDKAILLGRDVYADKKLNASVYQLRRRLVPLVPGAAATVVCPNPQLGTQSQGQKVIKDPNEYNSYISAINQQDPKQKTLAVEAFIDEYPCTIMMEEAEAELMSQYQQADDIPKTMEMARRVLQINSNNVEALLLLAFYYEGQAAGGKGDVQSNVSQSRQYAERGLAALPNETKGDGMKDADFAKIQKEKGAVFEEAVGFAALNQNDYPTAQTYLRKALAHHATPDINAFYRLSVADLEATPQNLEGFWIIAKGIQMAQGAAKQQFADYGRRKYIRYHGSEEGWDQVVNTVKSSESIMPPAGFTLAVTAQPSPAELALKAVRENDPSALSIADWEYILSYRDASPANREASDKIWAAIQDLEKHGAAKLKFHVKVISSTKSSISAAITDDNQAANKADLNVTMQLAMLRPPTPGTMIDVIGVLTDYTSQPFKFSMSGGELSTGHE